MTITGAYVALLIATPVVVLALFVWAEWPQYRPPRGSDSLNPTPARTVDSMTPEERAQSSRYSTTDFDD